MMLSDIEINARNINWASLVKNLLSRLGFFEVWLNQGVGNVNQFFTVLQQRLKDQYIQDWSSALENSSRALFYRNIADFKFQSYFEIISVKKFRTAMTKLRVSSHRLEVETGRWTRPVSTLKQSYKEATFQTHFLFLSQVQNCTIFCQKTCLSSK